MTSVPTVFKAVVLEGILSAKGMAAFSPVLTSAQTEDIRHYVVQQNQLARQAGDISRTGR